MFTPLFQTLDFFMLGLLRSYLKTKDDSSPVRIMGRTISLGNYILSNPKSSC